MSYASIENLNGCSLLESLKSKVEVYLGLEFVTCFVNSYLELTSHPTVYLMQPPKAFPIDGAIPYEINDDEYVTLHRLASDGKVKGIFKCGVDYCKSISDNIRIDTHNDNLIMQKLILQK